MESQTEQLPASYKKNIAAKALIFTAIIVFFGLAGFSAYVYRDNLPFNDSIESAFQAAVVLYTESFGKNATTSPADSPAISTATSSDSESGNNGSGNLLTGTSLLTQTGTSITDTSLDNSSESVSPAVPATPKTNPTPKTVTAGPEQTHLYSVGSTTTTVSSAPKQTDLSVKILSVGTVDKTTGAYTSTSTLRASDRIAVRFSVENIGTKESGAWNFAAPLPTFPWYIFQSDYQESLKPGDRIEFTIGFDNIEKANDNVVRINIDPNSQVNEANKANNMASTTISGVVF